MNSHNTHLMLLVCQCTSTTNKDILYNIICGSADWRVYSNYHFQVAAAAATAAAVVVVAVVLVAVVLVV